MDDLFERFIGFTLVAAVGFLIGLVLLAIRIWRNQRNMPTPEEKAQLIAMIRECKAEGWGYSERLELLRKKGLRRDVADVLLGEAEKSNRAR